MVEEEPDKSGLSFILQYLLWPITILDLTLGTRCTTSLRLKKKSRRRKNAATCYRLRNILHKISDSPKSSSYVLEGIEVPLHHVQLALQRRRRVRGVRIPRGDTVQLQRRVMVFWKQINTDDDDSSSGKSRKVENDSEMQPQSKLGGINLGYISNLRRKIKKIYRWLTFVSRRTRGEQENAVADDNNEEGPLCKIREKQNRRQQTWNFLFLWRRNEIQLHETRFHWEK